MGRSLGFVGVIVTAGIMMYLYSAQLRHGAASGPGVDTSAGGAANITGVKSDLITMANAERGYFASQGKYASLDELISGNYIVIKGERPPYVYDIATTASGFRVTATRQSPGSPAKLWIDENMQVQSSD